MVEEHILLGLLGQVSAMIRLNVDVTLHPSSSSATPQCVLHHASPTVPLIDPHTMSPGRKINAGAGR